MPGYSHGHHHSDEPTPTSREFNQDTGRAKKAAENGPVFITDRGRPAHVLLSIGEYRRLTIDRRKIADLLALPGAGDIELETSDFAPTCMAVIDPWRETE